MIDQKNSLRNPEQDQITFTLTSCVQDLQCRGHGDEDTDEQDGDFDDRSKREFIIVPIFLRRCEISATSQSNHHELGYSPWRGKLSREEYRDHDSRQKHKVEGS